MKILLATALLALTAPAMAANLVTNGGFENNGGNFNSSIANWSVNGHFAANNFAGVAAYAGAFFASTGCVNSYCSIAQALATTAGVNYTLSFAFNRGQNVDFGGASTLVQWNGVNVGPDIGVGPIGWNLYSYNVTGTGNDTLSFNSFQNPAWTGIDSVSVNTAVPEAASWAMMIAGFGLVGATMRRRTAALAA